MVPSEIQKLEFIEHIKINSIYYLNPPKLAFYLKNWNFALIVDDFVIYCLCKFQVKIFIFEFLEIFKVPHLAWKHMACVPMFTNFKPKGTVFCLYCLMTILCSYVIFYGCIAFWSPLLPDDFLFCRCVPTHLFILTFWEIYAISSIHHLILSDNVLVITMVNHIIFNHEFLFY